MFGVTIAGSFSAAFVDCGLFVNGVRGNTTYRGDCVYWNRYDIYDWQVASSVRDYVAAQMDSLSDYFFYTWKVRLSCFVPRLQSIHMMADCLTNVLVLPILGHRTVFTDRAGG